MLEQLLTVQNMNIRYKKMVTECERLSCAVIGNYT